MKQENKQELFLLLLSLTLFFFDHQGWLRWLKTPLQKPLLSAEEKVYSANLSLKQTLNIFSNRQKQSKKIDDLENRLRQAAVEQNQLAACQQENEAMKKLLEVPFPQQWQFLPAKVIGAGGALKIDQGDQSGIKVGMMVVSENILVGRVAQTGANFSQIQTPLNKGVKIPVVFRRADQAKLLGRGILESQAETLVLEEVLQQEPLQSSDWVLTSGEADWLPDLLIGQVEEILSKPAEVYKRAKVKPMLDYDQLRTVFVVIS